MVNECWLPVKGYENSYEVSDNGNVRSLNFNKCKGLVKNLKLAKTRGGYLFVCLVLGGLRQQLRVNRLVAKAFVVGEFEGAVVNHDDGNNINNHASNLEWMTIAQNLRHSRQVLRRGKIDRPIQLKASDGSIHNFPSQTAANLALGIYRGALSRVLTGKYISTRGFTARYTDIPDPSHE